MRAPTQVSMMVLCLASAFTMNSHAAPAIVFNEELCFLAFVPPEGDPIPLEGNKLNAVVAVSGNNTTPLAPAKYTCHGELPFPIEYPMVQRGACFIPVTPFGPLLTEDGFAVFTPGGTFTAQCRFPKDTSPQN